MNGHISREEEFLLRSVLKNGGGFVFRPSGEVILQLAKAKGKKTSSDQIDGAIKGGLGGVVTGIAVGAGVGLVLAVALPLVTVGAAGASASAAMGTTAATAAGVGMETAAVATGFGVGAAGAGAAGASGAVGTAGAAGAAGAIGVGSAGAAGAAAAGGLAVETAAATSTLVGVLVPGGAAVGGVGGGIAGAVGGWRAVDEDLDSFLEGAKAGFDATIILAPIACAILTVKNENEKGTLSKLSKKGNGYVNKNYVFKYATENDLFGKVNATSAKKLGSNVCQGGEKELYNHGSNEFVALRNKTKTGIRDNDESIIKEASKMKALDGTEGVVPITGFARVGDNYGFVCPKFEGSADNFAKFANHSGADLCSSWKHAATGLKNIHDKGFAHFDVKPENLFMDHQGKLFVGDLGGATAMDGNGFASVDCITPSFAAPELFRDLTAAVDGEKYDVYSLGRTLCDVIAGICNETGGTPSEQLCAFLSKLLEADPSKRWNMNEVLDNWPDASQWNFTS